MEHLKLNLSGIQDKKQLHCFLAEQLHFPRWYGHNLDALIDCLIDLKNTHITLAAWQDLPWAEPFWDCFRIAQEENPTLQVSFQKKYYLFDFDGTLVDSMPTFAKAMLRILDENGISYGSDIIKLITPLGLKGSANYFVHTLGLQMEETALFVKMKDYVLDDYTHTIPAKANVESVLKELKNRGASLNILTASPHTSLDVCLQRLQLWDLFDNIWSCEDFCTTKADPDIYVRAAEKMGTTVENVLFLDDNLDADTTAKKAGMQVCGVFDPSSAEYEQQIRAVCDHYICDFAELLEL